MFNAKRLTLARQRKKLTKKALAEKVGADQKTIVRYEQGSSIPTEESLRELAAVLAFPVPFFHGPDIDEPVPSTASFRSLSTMPARDRDAALAAGALAFVVSDWVEDRFNLPSHDLIDFKEGGDPEAAADMLRQKWGLGAKPIKNMLHMLEAKGVRVFSLTENTRTVDAFSMWRRNLPYIFLNTTKTSERSRFDSAHELGHLVLHKHGGPQGGRVVEDQANQFASAFLMPEADVRARLPRVHSLSHIVEAKAHWKVSVAALNYRLHKLGLTTEWQYRNFCIQIAQQFKQEPKEPFGIPREESLVWAQVLNMLREDGIGKHKIADDLSLPVSEVESLIFRLTNMQSISGSGASTGKSQAKLSVV